MQKEMRDEIVLFSELTGIPVHVLMDRSDVEQFCKQYRFSSGQIYLVPEALQKLYQDLAPMEMISLRDCFRLRFVFAVVDGVALAIGPYCTQLVTESILRHFMNEKTPPEFPTKHYLTFRSQFTVMKEKLALERIQTLFRHLCKNDSVWQVQRIEQSIDVIDEESTSFATNYAETIEERYRIEQEMVNQVLAGRPDAAVDSYLLMQRSVAYSRLNGQDLERARMGAAITCTTVRQAAFQAGLPAVLADKLETENWNAVSKSASTKEIDALVQDMIYEFSRAIYLKRNKGYSKLILCMIYTIEHEYQQPLSAAVLAQQLDVSVNYLVKRCRQETGLTPNAYIRKVRMDVAARLLRNRYHSIQDISAEVGILDTNYFARQFKQVYGVSPSAYQAEQLA